MRYQEKIYIQNDNRAVRNKDILNVNMSSDFCVFKSPMFDISGATKIQCDSITFDLTGYSFTNILTGATNTCFTLNDADINCYSSTTWVTKVYENNEIKYSGTFYTTTTLTGDTPTDAYFLPSVTSIFDALNYNYTQSGSTFTVYKPYGVSQLEIGICISINLLPIPLGCPTGYVENINNDGCQQITYTSATYNGISPTIAAGSQNAAYGQYGTYFYPSIENNGSLPVYYIGNALNLLDKSGGTITALNINQTQTFWGNPLSATTSARLNNTTLNAPSVEWAGFSKCLDIPASGTYYIGIAADNRCKVTVNGVLFAEFTGICSDNFKKWSVFPFELKSGKNIIEMYGQNDTGPSSFGAEIYYPIDYPTLTGATSTAATQSNVIFSTIEYLGETWDLGTTFGYSCPTGYSLDTCSLPYTCTKILRTEYTGCSESCLDNCTIVRDETFSYIDNTSTGVYVIDTATATTIPMTFNFTANTESFTANNATFKFEIYKYNNSLSLFLVNPSYTSDVINYSTFSGTNQLQLSIPISGLSLDGDYIIKGYYEADACTTFMNKLGKKIDTSIYKSGSEYQLYEPTLDYYFVGITKADKPIFTQSQSDVLAYYDALPLYQQVIIVDNNFDLTVTSVSEETEITSNLYYRTGSTFTLQSEYLGDVIVTLNGLSLAKDVDYSLTGTVLTFFGEISNNDIITIIYTRTSTLTLVSNTIELNTEILSGATGTQGDNKYFYNTTTDKYEIYTDNEPLDSSKFIVTLNGVTLTSDIDFYQSTSNKNRIILAGQLMLNDIITIIYYPKANIIDGIVSANNYIGWYIPTVPQTSNGEFSLEYSTSSNFSSYTVSATVPYQPLVTNYNGILSVTGDVGDKYYYRVKNTKNYASICGDLINSVEYSETIPIVIQSNGINSY